MIPETTPIKKDNQIEHIISIESHGPQVMLSCIQEKCGADAYLYGGSGKALTRISNTPHPYG